MEYTNYWYVSGSARLFILNKDEDIVQIKCCDVVFKPLTSVDIGNQHFDAGQPVLYIDTAKTSSLEQAVSTVYAQGGQGMDMLW